jgi:hypothetical protein
VTSGPPPTEDSNVANSRDGVVGGPAKIETGFTTQLVRTLQPESSPRSGSGWHSPCPVR